MRSIALLAPVVVVSIAAPALAQDASAVDVETARAAFLQGLDLRDRQHDMGAAVGRFKAAYALVPTPRIGFELGRTLRTMGDLVGARAAFVAAVQLPVRPNESAEARKARSDADAQAADLENRIPQLMIHLTGSGQIHVDGEAVRRDALMVPRRLNPGNHVVQVQVDGDVKAEQTIPLREGDRKEVTMSPGVEAHITINTQQQQVVVQQQQQQQQQQGFLDNNGYQYGAMRHSNIPTKAGLYYTAAVLGGLGLIPGFIALDFMKSAQDACTDAGCDSTFNNNKNLAIGFAIATDVLWGTAIICFIAAIAIPSYSENSPVTVGFSPTHGGGGVFSAVGRF